LSLIALKCQARVEVTNAVAITAVNSFLEEHFFELSTQRSFSQTKQFAYFTFMGARPFSQLDTSSTDTKLFIVKREEQSRIYEG
jgi:hypothetical protein